LENAAKKETKKKVSRYEKKRLRVKIDKINEELKESGLMLETVSLTRLKENTKKFVLHVKN
jgi:hypothetical protein